MPGVLRLGEDGVHVMAERSVIFKLFAQWFFMVKNWATESTVPKNGWFINATITGSLNKHQTQAEVPEV